MVSKKRQGNSGSGYSLADDDRSKLMQMKPVIWSRCTLDAVVAERYKSDPNRFWVSTSDVRALDIRACRKIAIDIRPW